MNDAPRMPSGCTAIAFVCAILALLIFTWQHKLAVTQDPPKAQSILHQMCHCRAPPGYEPKYAFDFVRSAGIKVKMVTLLPETVPLPDGAPLSIRFTAFEVLAMPSIKE